MALLAASVALLAASVALLVASVALLVVSVALLAVSVALLAVSVALLVASVALLVASVALLVASVALLVASVALLVVLAGVDLFQNASFDIQFFHVGVLYASLSKLKSETGTSVLKSQRILLPKLVKRFATVSRVLRTRFLEGSTTVLTAPSMTSAAPANGEIGTW